MSVVPTVGVATGGDRDELVAVAGSSVAAYVTVRLRAGPAAAGCSVSATM